jgi:phage-related tail protein
MSSFRWNGDEAAARVGDAAALGLNKAARALLAESQARVPVDSGDLRASGATHDANAGSLVAAVAYNASNRGFPYGIAVHEGTHMNFQTAHNPRAGAKYLEGPAVEMEGELMGVVAMEIQRALGS